MRLRLEPAKRRGLNIGLKKFPAAGKTGTAYDFTDALFAGYDSKITCAVWAGFDKPQKIYRGAFGRELAMPVWVDIMNAATEHYPPQEIKRPAGLKEVEICSRSGLLATDKCYDTVKGADRRCRCKSARLTWKLRPQRKCQPSRAMFTANRARRIVAEAEPQGRKLRGPKPAADLTRSKDRSP